MRDTVGVRFSEAERRQVGAAAERVGKAVSSFVREAALAASARVTGKVSEREDRDELPIVAVEPVWHMVDGGWTGRYLA
jgi:hypothetical protein